MTEEQLANEDFEEARVVYEALLANAAGADDPGAARERALAKTDKLYSGFAERFQEHERARRMKFSTVQLMPVLRADGAVTSWYTGPSEHSGEWPRYRRELAARLPEKAVEGVDESTTQILGLCANPEGLGDRRKGLVIGYVQSGKTANYAGLVAKAVDAGYRIVIVLAGMHTNLRVQTQTRLERDLGMGDLVDNRSISWHELTGPSTDIGTGLRHGFLSSRSNVAVMVVKKHEKRLANVAGFLKAVNRANPDFLLERPVLIVDDESDQATPNTLAAKDKVSKINRRVRDIWREVRTGTYVAYTATPFANVFIDPDEAEDLYPDDFVVALPRPEGYLGADRFFDTAQTAEGTGDTIYSLAREVPDEEARILAPQSRDLTGYDPEMTDSLGRAIRWFVIATAIRRTRTGRAQHSSMLIHTSHRTEAHERLERVVAQEIQDLRTRIDGLEEELRALFEAEIDRAAALRDAAPEPDWVEVRAQVRAVLDQVTVKIDNGVSMDRLVYTDERAETVIAIGGGTLSRGLTLEGLVVSYFLRTSNTYDTLLQMGRWFGFRPGYADLVRVWVGPGLLEDYAHLARVERELREEVAVMSRENRTPREMAVKVLAHPGRLEITSAAKMSTAVLAQAGLGGTRRQTIYLDTSREGALSAQSAVRRLVASLRSRGTQVLRGSGGRGAARPPLLLEGVANEELLSFLEDYWIAPSDRWLQPSAMRAWLRQHGEGLTWNLVLASGSGHASHPVDIAGLEIGTVSRTPLQEAYWDPSRLPEPAPGGSKVVNIRALMSGGDQMLDLKIRAANGALRAEDAALVDGVNANDVIAVREARKQLSPGTGLLVLYLVDKDSQPAKDAPARTAMDAEEHPVGLGIVFPSVETEAEGEFWAADLKPQLLAEDEDLEMVDGEADHVVGEGR